MPLTKGLPFQISVLETVPTYEEFLKNHLLPNKPCLITPDLIRNWPATTLWTRRQKSESLGVTTDPQPDWDYIRSQYGDEIVTVAKCKSRSFSDQERVQLPLRDVIDLWVSGNGDLYVKDWHLAKSVRKRDLPQFYYTPDIFLDDWMNSFWENSEDKDDFRFVYMGVSGTFTSLHRDVYTSYSWSTNITGTKQWRLFPPEVAHYLRQFPNRTTSEIVYDVREVDANIFRDYHKAEEHMIVVEQPPGWTIFVPSGWYHQGEHPITIKDLDLNIGTVQVENVTDAISINHNWCNINNLPSMYASLCAAVSDVEDALSDVYDLFRTRSGNPDWEKEWIDIVQDVLQKDSGWDWSIFWKMVALNLGQMKVPPEIPQPIWPVIPSSLRPSPLEVRNTVAALLRDFTEKNQKYIVHTPWLSTVIVDLLNSLS